MFLRARRRLVGALSVVAAIGFVAVAQPALAFTGGGGSIYSCGGIVLKADGTPWRCTFDDEFSGSQLDRTKWVPQTSFAAGDPAGTYACTEDNPNNVSVSNGSLHLALRQVATPVSCASYPATKYTTGEVSTYRLFSQQYGRFEARVRNTATQSPGLQEDFWLWPDDRYTVLNPPTTGEIDIAEMYSQYASLAIPFLHYTYNDNGGPIPGTNTAWNCAASRGVWNTYTLVWTSTSLTISVNGTTCLVNTSGDAAFNERYIIALTQFMGLASNAPVAGTPIPATTDVDYVRVWK